MPKGKAENDVEDVLSALQSDFNAKFGDGAAARLDDATTLANISYSISTGNMVFDSVLRGGRPFGSSLLPFGRQVEISGLENSGKTTFCAQVAAQVQRQGGIVVITDTEERIDEAYWTTLGVNTNQILRLVATSVEDVFNKQYECLNLVRKIDSDRPVLMLWDSLGGTSTANLIDPKSKDSPMDQASKAYGRAAKEISDGMRLINEVVAITRTCYLYTNHMYAKMGVTWGDKYETYGGQKPKYMATVRLRLSRVGRITETDPLSSKDMEIGSAVRVKALKNSMAPQLLERDAVLLGGRGFVNEYTVFDAASRAKLITRKGSWSTWITPSGEEVKFQGFNGFEKSVVTHKEYPELYATVNESL